jgi:hypothetical protein
MYVDIYKTKSANAQKYWWVATSQCSRYPKRASRVGAARRDAIPAAPVAAQATPWSQAQPVYPSVVPRPDASKVGGVRAG